MKVLKILLIVVSFLSVCTLLNAQSPQKGSIKGKVRVDSGSASGVTVTLSSGNRSVAHVETNRKGDFSISDIEPGAYDLTFRKPGLAVGKLESVEVKAGKSNDLGDRLIMHVDEGSLAFIEGSVFTAEGRGVPNTRVDIVKINTDGSLKKLESKYTDDTGQFAFRLSPALAKYRLSVKVGSEDPISKEVQIDGALVYRLALNLQPRAK